MPEAAKKLKEDPSQWLEEHGDYLFRAALLYTKDQSLAEDLVQDTLLSAFKNYQSFEGRSSFRTWLRTILRNKVTDHFRKKSKHSEVSFEEEGNPDREFYFNRVGIWNKIVPSWGKDPEEALTDKDLGEVIQQCLSKLPENLRRIFSMRVIDGLDSEEICKILNISSSNSYVMLYRSRLMMRSCLEKKWLKA